MSLVVVCYRAILQSARNYGWKYSGGIHLEDTDSPIRTYKWFHWIYEPITTRSAVPDDVIKPDMHTILHTVKYAIQQNPFDEGIDELLLAVKEIDNLKWTSEQQLPVLLQNISATNTKDVW